MSKNYDRDGNDSTSQSMSSSNAKLGDEILMHALKSGKPNITREDINRLIINNSNFDKNIGEDVYSRFQKRLKKIQKMVDTFKEKYFNKINYGNLSPEEKFRKIKKYAKKFGVGDEEFDMFQSLLLRDYKFSDKYTKPINTPITNLLGSTAIYTRDEPMNISAVDTIHINEIIGTKQRTSVLHSNITYQSLQYRDCDIRALYKGRNYNIENVFCHVHPIIAALFLPKFISLDESMLLSNFGRLVDQRYHGHQISLAPDFNLYNNLMNDPSGYLCTDNSAIEDIKYRYNIQVNLWENVLNLRQGNFYKNNAFTNLTQSINSCKTNLFDSPDLTYVSDEGTYLRRLLATFGIRPTITTTTDTTGNMYGNQLAQYENITLGSGITQITSTPMITVRLPYNISGNRNFVNLKNYLDQTQWFKEGQYVVPKRQTVVKSNDILIFYVNRRYQTINLARTNNPCNFANLPTTLGSWNILNTSPVYFDKELEIMDDVFHIRSVVLVETNPLQKQQIVGCSSAIVIPNYENNQWNNTDSEPAVLHYNPIGAGVVIKDNYIPNFMNGEHVNRDYTNGAITYVNYNPDFNLQATDPKYQSSFFEMACERGVLFIYQKLGNKNTQPCN